MGATELRRWVRRVVGVLGTLAAAAVLMPATARADCGDYVVIGNPMHAAPMNQHAQPMPSERPADAPRPCKGLRCSGGMPVSPMQPAPPAPERGDDYGLGAGVAPAASEFTTACGQDDSRVRPTGPRTMVYHPPR